MSLRNRVVVPILSLSLALLIGCGSSSNVHVTPPPSGSFSNSNLNGAYVFSVSGTDVNGAPYAIVGTFTANGSGGNGQGGITAGAVDINDGSLTSPLPNQSVNNSSSYSIGVDGRGKIVLGTSTPFQNIALDIVLQDSSHGLVSEFDGNGSGSGTLDLQTAGVTPQGTYAFSFAGSDSSGNSLATAGNFTVGSGGAISGQEDFNDGGFGYVGYPLSGAVVPGPSSSPASTLVTNFDGGQIYDVYAIDAAHLKFIEMDTLAIVSGDALSQTSGTIPAATFAFTLAGLIGPASNFNFSGVAGFLVADGSGNITSASSEDVNESGTTTSVPLTFNGQYSCSTGRCAVTLSGFAGGTNYAAYPYNSGGSAGLFLLELDPDLGLMSGAAFQQTSTNFSTSDGYGLNLTGINLGGGTGSLEEVDDISEFVTSSTACGSATGSVVTGIIDENFDPGGGPNYKMALCGNYTTPDTSGRGSIVANAGTSNVSTLNGGFGLIFYTVDGTTFPFLEADSGQVAVGVFVLQNPQASSSQAAAKFHMFVPPRIRPSSALKKLARVPKQK